MQKKHLLVGLVMIVASAVSYEFVHLTEASPAQIEVVEAATPAVGVAAATAPLVMATDVTAIATMFESVSDAAMLGATGAALLFIASSVRRRAC